MIKPDAVAAGHIGAILDKITAAGFRISALKMTRLSKEKAGDFYAVHRERPFYGELVEFMSSGHIVAAILEKDNAVSDFRTLIGATDPAKAEETRLKGLWAYHDGEDKHAGGRVRSAYLYSSNTLGPAEPGKEAPRARLVLRRHPQWGDDVYLLTDRGHFACPSPCTVTAQFDDAPPVTYPGKLPETGEPAMFVEDFVAIVSAIPGAKKVRFTVTLDDGSSHTPEFELGGYDATTIGTPLRPAN